MYEYSVPVEDHLELPVDIDLEMQFPMAIGAIGDFASELVKNTLKQSTLDIGPRQAVVFAGQVLHAFYESLLREDLSSDLLLIAAAAFYLGDAPGRSVVNVRRLNLLGLSSEEPLFNAVRVALDNPWIHANVETGFPLTDNILKALQNHFRIGEGNNLLESIQALRYRAYTEGAPYDLLLSDILGAISLIRITHSGWTLLPEFSGLPSESWKEYLSRPEAIKEMWPSQRMLGEAGLYSGQSGIVQMPTSAGKTRATEIILRSAFLAERTNLAVVVAPFRALCHEIATDLGIAFSLDGYRVNQLSDALQPDFTKDLLELLNIEVQQTPHVVVLTPEKLLYVLRQEPAFVEKLGLIIYDEGHQFDTGTRGVTYELLLTSIKRLLPKNAQTVLISAVIQNAAALAKWLLSDERKVVSDNLRQTRSLVSFVSLPQGMDGQLQFNPADGVEQRFYVPRVIVKEKLANFPGESKKRVFPSNESGQIALYLALLLVQNGGVAIYSRTIPSAEKIIRDAVKEIFPRGVSLPAPIESCNKDEIQKFKHLYAQNFGPESYHTKGVELGLFAHHGNTPHGLRLAIEHAMRAGHIRFIVCTSTLAQGVNLPIRYLLITSAMQGQEKIKARDFHNLMGRAGRAGMHGEGTVIFTDYRLYDERNKTSWNNKEKERWISALDLLRPDSAEPTGSTLLELLEPMHNVYDNDVIENPSPFDIATLLIDDPQDLYRQVSDLPERTIKRGFSSENLIRQLNIKKKTIEAIESFLMTYRGDVASEAFIETSRSLARETLAFSLANEQQCELLEKVFEKVAMRIDNIVPNAEIQARYGKTLMGVDTALAIDNWVNENQHALLSADSPDTIFTLLWPLFTQFSTEKRIEDTQPPGAIYSLAVGWLAGKSFIELVNDLQLLGAGYPYRSGLRSFQTVDVVDLCEQTFGFEFALVLAAVRGSFEALSLPKDETAQFLEHIDLLQKCLKYGLPSKEDISYFEAGFSERIIAQSIANEIGSNYFDFAASTTEARKYVRLYADDVKRVIQPYPSYFTMIFESITA